jgi:hypothetical protein
MSFLSGRTFFVTISGVRSMECDIPSEVTQDAVLSLTLFNIFTFDFQNWIKYTWLTTYSKAVVIIDQLQSALNCVKDYNSNWRFGLNSSQTQAVFFTKRRTRELPTLGLLLDDHSIPWENRAKYLGLILDKTLTFALHVEHISGKIQKMIRILYPLINKKSKWSLPQRVVVQLATCYSSVAWQDCAEAHERRLQILQNKCLKLILNLTRYHSTSNVHKHIDFRKFRKYPRKVSKSAIVRTRWHLPSYYGSKTIFDFK